MPNWCSNKVTFTNPDPAMIKRVVEAYNRNELFAEFKPCPSELLNGVSPAAEDVATSNTELYGHPDWYSWCCANWGTKWDINSNGDTVEITDGERAIDLWFDTAWGPPLPFFSFMEQLGFSVDAFYYEPGIGFCGRYTFGEEEHFDIEGDAKWVRENIPIEIDDAFSISDGMEEWDEDDEEDT